jgi:site-specific recombinase XerD
LGHDHRQSGRRNYDAALFQKTLKAYADWSRKFQGFLRNKPPGELSAVEVKSYLAHLAVTCHVAASTQNQAFNALLFLYRHILKKDFGDHKDIPRAKKSKYIPVVLSRKEIDAVVLPRTCFRQITTFGRSRDSLDIAISEQR